MLAQSAKPPMVREVTSSIRNCVFYTDNGQNKISFDVYVKNIGSEFVEMGNSSFLFKFPVNACSNPVINFNDGYFSGYNTFVKLIGNKILMIQYFAEGGGWVLDTSRSGEWMFNVVMDIHDLNKFYLIWNVLDSAIVDRNLQYTVKNNFEGEFKFQ